MKAWILLTALLGCSLFACRKGTDSLVPQKGYVTGTVRDTRGQPIEGAFVFISSTGPYSSGLSVHTDAKGQYRIKMDYGAYRIYATFEKEYAGRTYEIQLKPSNADAFSVDDSPVIDFNWVLSGQKPIPLQGYFGGYIGLYQGETNIPKNEVEFTFTATELIDGSATNGPLVIKPTTVSTQYLEDIPLGKYTVKAIHKPASGVLVRSLAVKNKDTGQTGPANGSVNIEFKPESSGFYRANLEFFEP